MNANEIINEKQNTNTSSTLTVLRLKYFTSDNFINKFDKVLIVSIVIRDLINLTKEKENINMFYRTWFTFDISLDQIKSQFRMRISLVVLVGMIWQLFVTFRITTEQIQLIHQPCCAVCPDNKYFLIWFGKSFKTCWSGNHFFILIGKIFENVD